MHNKEYTFSEPKIFQWPFVILVSRLELKLATGIVEPIGRKQVADEHLQFLEQERKIGDAVAQCNNK